MLLRLPPPLSLSIFFFYGTPSCSWGVVTNNYPLTQLPSPLSINQDITDPFPVSINVPVKVCSTVSASSIVSYHWSSIDDTGFAHTASTAPSQTNFLPSHETEFDHLSISSTNLSSRSSFFANRSILWLIIYIEEYFSTLHLSCF